MTDPQEDMGPPDILPNAFIERLDSLTLPELKATLSYVEGRIDALRTPIEAEIKEEVTGKLLRIEAHGTTALVWMHHPDPDGAEPNTDIVFLYHVRREPRPDGTESLHWAYLGEVYDAEEIQCGSCGKTIAKSAATCPHCGSENTAQSEMEE